MMLYLFILFHHLFTVLAYYAMLINLCLVFSIVKNNKYITTSIYLYYLHNKVAYSYIIYYFMFFIFMF